MQFSVKTSNVLMTDFFVYSTGDTNEVHGWTSQAHEWDSQWYQDFEVLCLGKGFSRAGPGIQREGA